MKKIIEKYGKKKVYISLATALVLACVAGVGGTVVYANNKKQAILDSIYIRFIENPTVEYGTETVDYQSFIKSSVGEVTLPTETIDTKEVGSKELVYKVSKEGLEKEEKVNLEIKDTKAPEITLKEETVTIEVGAEFDPKSNIESVIDPIDGTIEEYEVTHNLDNNTVGEYKVTIKAVDKNGNETEKSYTVVVKEVEQSVASTQGNATPSYNNGYSGGYTSSRPSATPSYSSGSVSKPSTNNSSSNGNSCAWVHPNQIGNSGRVFNTWEEADAWAQNQIDISNGKYFGYSVISVNNQCGQDVGWTVHFKNR